MKRRKRAERYLKKHKNIQVEDGANCYPQTGGWNFIGMQILVVILYWIVVIPIIGYLQFKNLEIYKNEGIWYKARLCMRTCTI